MPTRQRVPGHRTAMLPVPASAAARLALACLAATVLAAGAPPRALAQGGRWPAERSLDHHPVWGPPLAAQAQAHMAARPSLERAEADAARAEHGLRGSVEALPSATLSARPGEPVRTATALVITGRVEWRHDPLALANARIAAHRAEIGTHEAALRAAREALLVYLDLRRAHVALANAEAAVASRRATLDRAEASVIGRAADPGAAGAASDTQLELARLELQRALAAVDRAALDLAAAERAAASHGFDPTAAADAHRAAGHPDPLEGWRIALPTTAAELAAAERARLDLALAQAREARAGPAALLDDLRLEAALSGTDARLRFGLGLDQGRPAGFAEASLRDTARPSWSVTLRARIRVSDDWSRDHAVLALATADAGDAVLQLEADADWRLAELLRAAREAEEDVAFAEASLALGRAALHELGEERRTLAAAARAGDDEALARLRRFDEAAARALLGHLRERDAFLRAWDRYLRAAERALAAVGAPLEVIRAP
jgi:hypothetical protein